MEPDADLASVGRLLGDPNRVLFAPPTPVRSLRGSVRMRSLRWARMCYDHLAGAVGVAVTDTLA